MNKIKIDVSFSEQIVMPSTIFMIPSTARCKLKSPSFRIIKRCTLSRRDNTSLTWTGSILLFVNDQEISFFSKSQHRRGITFPRPTAPGPSPRLRPPDPFTFLRPPPQITFSRPLTMELLFHGPPASRITFSRPLVITIVCHVFFNSFKQNSTYSLFENSFHQNVLSYTNQLQCEAIGCFFFIWCKLKVIF